MRIGILGFQGGIDEHRYMVLESCRELGISCETVNATRPQHLRDIDGIILPGGESTTITKLITRMNMDGDLRDFIRLEHPVFGTCAGAIILAKRVVDRRTGRELANPLGVLDIAIERNYYGRQRESFEIDIGISILGEKPFRAIFIRAPAIVEIGSGVISHAKYGESHVFVQQGNIIATTFHPELSGDTRIHKYFINLVKSFTKQ